MVDQLPRQRSVVGRPFGERALRWSWYLFLLSYPWHLVGGGIAYAITDLSGGDFGAGEGVPGYVYAALYVWMMAPLIASIVVGALGWLKWRRPAAIVPALASAVMIFVVTVFSYQEFWG
jgi:fatty acid desaturase